MTETRLPSTRPAAPLAARHPSRRRRQLPALGLACAVATAGAVRAATAGDLLAESPAAPAAVQPSASGSSDTPASPFASLTDDLRAWEAQNAPQTVPQEKPAEGERLRTWEMPAVEVIGEAPPALREEERIGPYSQPRWTAHRRFTTVRTYVLPEGEIDGEYWARITEPQHGKTKIRNLYEVEIGLPNRFQLDLYLRGEHEGEWDPGDINGQQIEGRYAFANWGELWGNPTVYLEWGNNYREPDTWEGKLLLTDELAPSWHWGANLSVEQQTTGDKEREVQVTYGISKTITDEKFSIGGEIKAQRVNTEENRDDFSDEFFVGPSFQFKPTKRTHIDFAPLIGVGGESPNAQIFFIFGYEF